MRDPDLPAAEILVAVLADEDTLLLFGSTDRPVPASGVVRVADQKGAGGHCRALSWSRNDPDQPEGRWFVAALRVPQIARIGPARLCVTSDEAVPGVEIPHLPHVRINPLILVSSLKTEQPERLADVFDFLHAVLTGPDLGPASPRARRFLGAFLRALAQADGFAEILGAVRQTALVLQGWSFHLQGGCHPVIVETDRLEAGSGSVGTFGRTDLDGRARGVVVVVPAAEPAAPAAVRRLYYRAGQGYYYLEMFEQRSLLGERDTVPHLKSMLPSLELDPATARLFRRVATAQYEGHETVSTLGLPVRAAVDLALLAPGHGVFVGGWLLDPARLVQAVTLRSTRGFAAGLAQAWVRTRRADVSTAFAQDPQIAAVLEPGDDRHGFLAFVPHGADGEPGAADAEAPVAYYLELVLADESRAFLPLEPAEATSATLRRLLGSFDLQDPAAEHIIGRHVGPIVWAAARLRRPPEPEATVLDLGVAVARPRVSVVIPVIEACTDLDIHLACFAVDPDFACAEILVAAPAALGAELAGRLRRHAGFYGLHVRLVLADEAGDAFDALDVGAAHARAEHLAFLAPSVLPAAPGWIDALERGLSAHASAGLISPTLLYEDESIRFAGIRNDYDRADPDRPRLASRFAGYPRHWLDGQDITPVYVGTTDCCLLARRLYQEIGGISRDYIGPEFRGLDLCLKIRAAGLQCLWAPQVEMFALDDGPGAPAPEYWRQTGAAVDRWGFDRKWSLLLANTGDPA